MTDIGKLISGFRVFKATTYQKQKDIIGHLLEQGQKPSTMIIACSDLRVAPAEIFSTNPGEIYLVTNMGGLIPKHDAEGIHGIMSAIENAVVNIGVETIIVMGHARCASIEIMMSDKFVAEKNGLSKSMKTWLSVAAEARDAVKKEMSDKSPEEQQSSCEHESIIVSMRNLVKYPYVAKAISKNKLKVVGWHFNIETGDIMAYDPATKFFEPIS
jgi:carbonic anhydrase